MDEMPDSLLLELKVSGSNNVVEERSLEGDKTSITFDVLEPGTAYSVYLTATNEDGSVTAKLSTFESPAARKYAYITYRRSGIFRP